MALEWTDAMDGVDWEELSALYRVAPLGDKPAANLKIAFENSWFRCFVRDNGRLVGVGRALADGIDVAYICDVALLPEYQGTGLGKALVNQLLALCKDHKKVIIYSKPGKEPFYRKFGFVRMKTAMGIFENPALMRERGYLDD